MTVLKLQQSGCMSVLYISMRPCIAVHAVQVRVDHQKGTLQFGSQQLESDKVRNHMAVLAKRLAKACSMVNPTPPAAVEQQRAAIMQLCRENIVKEHSRLLARKQVGSVWCFSLTMIFLDYWYRQLLVVVAVIQTFLVGNPAKLLVNLIMLSPSCLRQVIEKRKEQAEAQREEAEREEERKRMQAAREQELLEEKRRREEAARREKERLERELEEQEMEEARQLLEQTRKKKGGALVGLQLLVHLVVSVKQCAADFA